MKKFTTNHLKFSIQNSAFVIIALLLSCQFLILPHGLYAAPFADNADGTVTDTTTNLTWQKCSMGMTYSGGTCTGGATTATWQGALTYCGTTLSLAGKTWRLPSVKELQTLVAKNKSAAPTVDTSVFPGTVSGPYWSASTYVPNPPDAWYVNFNTGIVNLVTKTSSICVRCVSN